MPFYFRKSKKFGPFRVTASKSGLSWSVGTKGVRLTQNRRGTHYTVGAGGFYYRGKIKKHTPPMGTPRPLPQRPPGNVAGCLVALGMAAVAGLLFFNLLVWLARHQ